MLFKIGVLKKFEIFAGKHLCWSLFLTLLQNWIFIKKRFQHKCSPVYNVKFLRTAFFRTLLVAASKTKEASLYCRNNSEIPEETYSNHFLCAPVYRINFIKVSSKTLYVINILKLSTNVETHKNC